MVVLYIQMALNKRVYLKSRPGANGSPSISNFSCEMCEYPVMENEESIIVKTLYLSVDPYMRCCMNSDSGVDYVKAWQLGSTIAGPGIGMVLESKSETLHKGDFVISSGLEWPWKLYAAVKNCEVEKIKSTQDNLPLFLSIFGISGITAALGVSLKGGVEASLKQLMVVSAAAGGCGSVAGQVAKVLGCSKVVGICGSEEKCMFLMDELHFDGAICYKTQNVDEELSRLCPEGVDLYFDNVGGTVSDLVISHMNHKSCIILCGQISKYNEDVPYPPPLSTETSKILRQREINRERFLVLNHKEKWKEALHFLQKEYNTGNIKSKETIAHGLENAGSAFVSMMNGCNIGKQLVKL